MPREAQAVMVSLLLSGWIGQKGPSAIVSPAALDNLFDLSEQILLKAEEREARRDAQRRHGPGVQIGRRQAITGDHPNVQTFTDAKGSFFECPRHGKRVDVA